MYFLEQKVCRRVSALPFLHCGLMCSMVVHCAFAVQRIAPLSSGMCATLVLAMQGEYVGELLSQEECERRGQVYDIINSSYLFQLNTEWAIDARKAGSKLRCAACGPGLLRHGGTLPMVQRICILHVRPGSQHFEDRLCV